MEKTKTTALVLSGGGAKGAFQAGVLQVLKEQGYEYKVISGVSVGSLNGAMLATGQFEQMMSVWNRLTPEQVIEEHSLFYIGRKFLQYKLGFGRPPVSKFHNGPLRELMTRHLSGRPCRIPFHFGYVNLESGRYINATVQCNDTHRIDEDDLTRILASTAIPVMFNPVVVNDTLFVDGGLRNISPIREVLPYNPDRIVIIPTEPVKKTEENTDIRDILQIAFRSIEIMLDEIFNEDIDRFLQLNELVQQAGEQEAVLIKPNGMPYKYIEPLIIAPEQSLGSALDFDNKNVREMMETGRQRAREVLAQRNKTVA